jgi:hypothetical protein
MNKEVEPANFLRGPKGRFKKRLRFQGDWRIKKKPLISGKKHEKNTTNDLGSVCQQGIWPTRHFVNQAFCQTGICQPDILSTGQFINRSFHRIFSLN